MNYRVAGCFLQVFAGRWELMLESLFSRVKFWGNFAFRRAVAILNLRPGRW